MELAPLRSLSEFLLSEARFQVPDVNNDERWFNRIVSNLLYYQSNYFLSSVCIFLMVTFLHPQEMAYGLGVMALIFALAFYVFTQRVEVDRFKKTYPIVYTLAILATGYVIVYKLGCVVVLLLGIGLPVAFVTLHASLRLRNVRNKLTNASQAFGLAKKSPMAYLLNELGIEPDLKYL